MELLTGSGLVFAFKILGALGGYVFVILVSRTAGAAGYGTFELAFTAIMILSLLARLGLDGAVVRWVSRALAEGDPGRVRQVYARSAAAVLGVGAVLGLAFFLLAETCARPFDGGTLAASFRWVGAFTPAFALLQLNTETLRGMKRMLEFSLLQHGTVLVLAAAVFWPLSRATDVPAGLAAVQAFCVAVAFLLALSFLPLRGAMRAHPGAPRVDADFREVLRTALPMLVAGSLFLVMGWADTLMVGTFRGDRQVGIYRFAFRTASFVTFAQFAVNSMAAPMISGFFSAHDHDGLRRILRQIAVLNLALSVPVFLVLVLFPSFVLRLAGGAEFLPGVLPLRVLAAGQVVNALCGPVIYTLNMTGNERVSQRIVALAAALNVALNFALIPPFGILGAALATSVSMTVWNVMASRAVYRLFGIVTLPLPRRKT